MPVGSDEDDKIWDAFALLSGPACPGVGDRPALEDDDDFVREVEHENEDQKTFKDGPV